MKCKACNGKGYFTECIYESDEIGFVDKNYECAVCHGTGQIEQTHFEYMQSCTMEELGCFICEKLMHGACGECKFMKPIDGRHTCCLREWLKQPHTIKE